MARYSTFRNFLKMILDIKIAQNLPEGLIRPTLQSRLETLGVTKIRNSLFSGPNIEYLSNKYKLCLVKISLFLPAWVIGEDYLIDIPKHAPKRDFGDVYGWGHINSWPRKRLKNVL